MVRPVADDPGSGIDPYVEAYEQVQERDGHAVLSDYLPDPHHPLYPDVLCELVRVDLEYGWTRNRPRRLEEYEAEYPLLFRDPRRVRQVAFEEWRLRVQAGETVSPDDYRSRYGIEDLGGSSGLGFPDLGEGSGDQDDSARSSQREHSELFRDLHAANPRLADRVADALLQLPEPGSDFAGFRLIRELGRGVFGCVYLARQGDLAGRLVALKVSADLNSETRALAQLQHTHIVPIYSAHRVGPLRAVCMPYFGATTLAEVLRALQTCKQPPKTGGAIVAILESRQKVSASAPATAALRVLREMDFVRAVLWMAARLADGLAHAHERGIVHRDLKPANILLTDDGQPMLLDFNLAADTKNPDLAAAALVGGTLPYMAPEALEALRTGPRPADARGDLYALGLILFELLAGRPPFPIRRGSLDRILPRMVEDRLGPSPRLRSYNRAVSPAAESIVRRCLEPDPARRYQDARQLLDDLQRQLADLPLCHAPDSSPRERAGKWCRRHPRLSSATALGALGAILITCAVVGFADQQRRFTAVKAVEALRQLAETHEEARVLLLDPAADPSRRVEGIAACRAALVPFGVLESPGWRRSPLIESLPTGAQAELCDHVGELLMLWATALVGQATGQASARHAGLIREALRLNERAELCYTAVATPRALWAQRQALARLAGDEAGVERARVRAEEVPIRSPREYALLLVADPEGAPAGSALPRLVEASRRAPRDFALWMNLGQCYALAGRSGEAEDCFTTAMVLRPDSPWPYFHRGRVALERHAFEQARLDLDEALRLRPGLASAAINRALARLGRHDDAGAIADLTAALERGATETRLFLIRARARANAGDEAGANQDRAEGLRRLPHDSESWVARGLARLPADPIGALADFEGALKLDPRSRSALQDKASVLAEHLDRTDEAIGVLDRTVALFPDFVAARVGRGVLLARLGRCEAAHRDAEEARRRDLSGDTTYRAACIYALTTKVYPLDRIRALHLLEDALGHDSRWKEVALTDHDLDPLRDLSEFHELLGVPPIPRVDRILR